MPHIRILSEKFKWYNFSETLNQSSKPVFPQCRFKKRFIDFSTQMIQIIDTNCKVDINKKEAILLKRIYSKSYTERKVSFVLAKVYLWNLLYKKKSNGKRKFLLLECGEQPYRMQKRNKLGSALPKVYENAGIGTISKKALQQSGC